MSAKGYVHWFSDIRLADVPVVGGKNASLGELYSTLSKQGVRVPNGFALTADAYRDAPTAVKAWERLHRLLNNLYKRDVEALAKRASEAREIIHQATATDQIREQIGRAYRQLETEYGTAVAVAVRSSATAEDLPSASFAGQHESFLNVSGADDLFETCRRGFESIFTDRAISYRVDNGFDHFKVALSVGVMKMVRSDRAASGVMFTLDTESGFRDVVFITGVYGLGENIVQGTVDPDEFYVHRPTYRAGHRAVLSRSLGRKQQRMIYAERGGGTKNVPVPEAERERFCLADSEVLKLARSRRAAERPVYYGSSRVDRRNQADASYESSRRATGACQMGPELRHQRLSAKKACQREQFLAVELPTSAVSFIHRSATSISIKTIPLSRAEGVDSARRAAVLTNRI